MAEKNILSSKFFRRRKYIINPSFQIKYLLIVVGITAVILFLTTYIVNLTIKGSHLLENLTSMEIVFLTRLITRTVLSVSIVYLFIIFVLGIIISHRIAGPLYVFDKMFKLVSDGDLTIKLKLRKSDELQNLAESFQNMIDKLNSFIKTDKEKIELIKNKIEKINSTNLSKEEIVNIIQEIKVLLDELYRSFKI